MKRFQIKQLFPGIEAGQIALSPVLDHFHEGVMITDAAGVVLYMNEAQARIDDLNAGDTIGRTVTDLYRVDEGASPTMTCLKTGRPVVNFACFYRTHLGRVVNSIHNVYPIQAKGRTVGVVCTITDYKNIEETFLTIGSARPARSIASFGVSPTSSRMKTGKNGTRYTFEHIVGIHPELLAAVKNAKMASASPSPIMIFGETGTGKEMIAQAIHNRSPRRGRPYVAVNCAAIPENLLEGMLFGTSKGAFTGAIDKPGLLETADGGTLFLDEINSMSASLQVKLLRVLQERKVRRVGAMQEVDVDLKVISSVNVLPHEAIESGTMRADLFYRLAVVFIVIPPLRERMSDLSRLIAHFLAKANSELGKQVSGISVAVMDRFERYDWPGNVRELAHVIEGAMNIVGEEAVIDMRHLLLPLRLEGCRREGEMERRRYRDSDGYRRKIGAATAPLPRESPGETLSERKKREETDMIAAALAACGGNAAAAARRLGISPQLMHYKLKRFGIDRRRFRNLRRE
jgi:arginine utilization regulatory protein